MSGELGRIAESMAGAGLAVVDFGGPEPVPLLATRLRVVVDFAYAGAPAEPETVEVEVGRWDGAVIAQAVAEADAIAPADPGGTQLLYWQAVPLPERGDGVVGLGRVDLQPRRCAALIFRDVELDTVVVGMATEVAP
jgi:hypothetical protein